MELSLPESRECLKSLVGRAVVLDTAGPVTFLGTLKSVEPAGFWLEDANLRDRAEGHVSKEEYLCEARRCGFRPNRRRIFVLAHVVISASALDDVVAD